MRIAGLSEAINEALREEMRRDPRVIVMGEDVGRFGGAFQVTKGLLEEFGERRVLDTPLSEAAIIGCAVGAAMLGWRVVAEMQYSDFVTCGFDQITNQAAKLHFVSGGRVTVPMVLRMPSGAREHGAHHDQSLEAWFMHTPGLLVAIPSTAFDAKGLLKTAIRSPNPVVYFEHKMLYGTHSVGGRGLPTQSNPELEESGQWGLPDEEYSIPFGLADVKRQGDDVTIVATALMVHRALQAARLLEEQGVSVEVVDPRTLTPLDKPTILASVEKTSRAMVVTEETRTASAGSEISAMIGEEGFDFLDAPVIRLGAWDTPLPFSPQAQKAVLPSVEDIVRAGHELVRRNR
jgi:pyruvate dehydrogenase E1 component beta subunit